MDVFKDTKRYRLGGGGGGGEQIDSVNMANVLMLLSQGGGGSGGGAEKRDHSGRVFECKTCNRQFPSFQALGGHRASHKKPRLGGDGHGQAQGGAAKPRVHECSICGLEFAIGQALGGHMRRHRTTAEGFGHGLTEKPPGDQRGTLLDLNLPPLETDLKLGLGLEIVDKTPMVGCGH
ncbi:zinc finger protein ZAT12-like [Musa acuminata AAA Group]|uniref:zinc finger protein ZAT12-like n=1 Tax=Musa acuminata AAA Group TaxID=214697 RepID=UPI0031DC1E0E